MTPKITKILIANRGEIAVRIIRAAREMQIKTVAIFSEADRQGLPGRLADEAICIGPSSSAASYLNMEKIIAVAKQRNVDAIHPGYGFLSENADFARMVEREGIIFIGPSARSMEIMGDKLKAREAVKKYNIPMIPGTDQPVKDHKEAFSKARQIGYPLLIKASAGGGGKGMRVVDDEADLEQQLKRAMSEAEAAFGNNAVYLEKYIVAPKHIEIQVMADQHGNIIYLFDRECSVQRRLQKVVEEAPSPSIKPEVRKEMGEAAVLVAKSCDYTGAGTVEFILDQDMNFYFLEMNTRLQVEHPVTELITGIDLVKQQIKVANSEKLNLTQDQLKISGHAIECRIYAEDPYNDFLPDAGKILNYNIPKGPGIRLDDGYEAGMEVPLYYDPLIAKLISFGSNRGEARKRMIRALAEYEISGISTTIPFCQFVMEHQQFISGQYTTGFARDYFQAVPPQTDKEKAAIAALFGAFLVSNNEKQDHNRTYNSEKEISNWKKRSW
ncbi:MAG: acetyl-CoA carboxylase biotin carboxylase subunit [Candidatus Cyclobacteriaceae bacterium M3_2C_046]